MVLHLLPEVGYHPPPLAGVPPQVRSNEVPEVGRCQCSWNGMDQVQRGGLIQGGLTHPLVN